MGSFIRDIGELKKKKSTMINIKRNEAFLRFKIYVQFNNPTVIFDVFKKILHSRRELQHHDIAFDAHSSDLFKYVSTIFK